MGKFEIKKAESKVVATAKFSSKEDFATVKLTSGKVCLLHILHAEKLVSEKKATMVKSVDVIESKESSIRTKVVVDKK